MHNYNKLFSHNIVYQYTGSFLGEGELTANKQVQHTNVLPQYLLIKYNS
jgi:hypothetical protein